MNLILYTILILWSVVVVKNTLFWAYLWQVKEYRKDRLRAHFELSSSRKLLLGKRNVWLVGLLILAIAPVPALNLSAVFVAFIFYGFFAARSIQQFQDGSAKKPNRTLRVTFVVFASLLLCASIATGFFLGLPDYLLASILVVDLLLPLLVSLIVLTTTPLVLLWRRFMAKRATGKIEKYKDLFVIGVAGSYGKSTTIEALYAILSSQFNVLKTPRHRNTESGIAKVILKELNKDHEIFIVEMSAYKEGEILKSVNMTHPAMGVLTGLNLRHASLFGSIQNIQKAHYELIGSLPDKGLGVFNADNNYVREMARKYSGPKRIYTTDPLIGKKNQTIEVKNVKNTKKGLEIEVEKRGEGSEVLKTPLLGTHNAANVVGAATVAGELGVGIKEIKKALSDLKPFPHSLVLEKGIKETVVIDDSYSASLDGVLSALDTLSSMKGGQKIFIFHPITELGKEAENVHKKIGAHLAKTSDICIVTGKDYFKAVYKEAISSGMNKDNIFCLPDPRMALRKAQELTDKGDVILVENHVPEYVLKGLIL